VGITKPRKKWKALLSIDSEHKGGKIFLEYPPNSLIFNEKFLGGLERPAMWVKTDEEQKIPQAHQEASEQLHRYLNAHRLEGRPDLKTAIVVFIGKNKYEMFETCDV
jgi:hypothetical protein